MKKTVEITYLDVQLTIEGWFQPEEKEVLYDSNMEGYPGCSATFTIEKVLTESGDDIFGIFYDGQLDELKEMCLTNIEE